MGRIGLAVVSALMVGAVASGCRELSGEFRCAQDADCFTTTGPGRCQADGHCSVADVSCASGYRYVEASGGLSSQCVDGSLQLLWSADTETGDTSQWYAPCSGPRPCGNEGGGEVDVGAAGTIASQERAHSGKWSLKLTVTTPPESSTRMFRWHEPGTHPKLHYRAWCFIPQRYSVTNLYWNIWQWRSQVSATQEDSFFALDVGNRDDGSLYLYLYDWQLKQTFVQSLKDLPVGQWTQVEADYWCAGDNTGRITIWQDGTRLFDLEKVQTRYPNGDCRWMVGSSSDGLNPSPAAFYVDDAEIRLAP